MRLAHVVMDSAEKAASLAHVVVTGVIEVLLLHMIADVVALRDMPLAPSDVHNPFCQSINRLFQACWMGRTLQWFDGLGLCRMRWRPSYTSMNSRPDPNGQ